MTDRRVPDHVRGNPLAFHGDFQGTDPDHKYVAVPQLLARDKRLTNAAARVALILYSHAEDFEVSINRVATQTGMTPATVTKAFAVLIGMHWLAREGLSNNRYVTHLHRARPFTPQEMGKWNTYVSPGTSGKPAAPPQKIGDGPTPNSGVGPPPEIGLESRSSLPAQQKKILEDYSPHGEKRGGTPQAAGDHVEELTRSTVLASTFTWDWVAEAKRWNVDDEHQIDAMDKPWKVNGLHVLAAKPVGLNCVRLGATFQQWAERYEKVAVDWEWLFGRLLRAIACIEVSGVWDSPPRHDYNPMDPSSMWFPGFIAVAHCDCPDRSDCLYGHEWWRHDFYCESTAGRSLGNQLPDKWVPSRRARSLAGHHRMDVDVEAARFRSLALVNNTSAPNWDVAFNEWLTAQVS